MISALPGHGEVLGWIPAIDPPSDRGEIPKLSLTVAIVFECSAVPALPSSQSPALLSVTLMDNRDVVWFIVNSLERFLE